MTLFLGIIDGLAGADRASSTGKGREGGVGEWIAERRFARLASVGLTVLAPRPEAWGIVEILREEVDNGIPPCFMAPSLFNRLGDLGDFGGKAID